MQRRRFLCASLGGLAASLAGGAATAASARMNVLLIIADDLRVGGAFGSSEVRTPNIDRLAARGVSFKNAYNQFPLCAPSRASMLSGLRPNTTGVYDLSTHVRANVPDMVTLPQYFRQNGYFSGRIGKLYHQGVPTGIGKNPDLHDDAVSWDVAINPSGRDKQAERDGRIVNMVPSLPLGIAPAYLADEGADEEQTDGLVATKTIEMIDRNKDRPFFIAAGFYRPHVPEVAPKQYFDMYPTVDFKPEAASAAGDMLPASRGLAYAYTSRTFEQLSTAERETFVRAYYASTTFMDAQVGRILAGLERSGVADKTIVVFTSDHGFHLGEHGLWQKMTLWEQSTRVPLVIYAPGMKGNGAASEKVVELLDIYPTLADLAGLPRPPRVEGRSLRPLLRAPNALSWNYPARSQVPEGQSVRFENWRYTEWGRDGADGVELYDLERDPGEHRNLAPLAAYAPVIARLRPMLPGDPPPFAGPKIAGRPE